MRKTGYSLLLIICVLAVSLVGCDMLSDTTAPATKTTPSSTQPGEPSPTATDAAPSPTTATATTPPEPTIPPGSIALFATLSGKTQSDFIRVSGGRVSWDTTHYKALRYVPEAGLIDEFGWTSSKSYSKSYIYSLTAGDWVYVVKCFTDTGRKDVARLDPRTGKTMASFGTFSTGNMYKGFTICGDRIIYRSKISEDLWGKRTGGGHVMAMAAGSYSAIKLLDYYDDNNQGEYIGIGDELVTIVRTYEDDAKYYDIYRVNPDTMAMGDLLYSFGAYEFIDFYAGDECLYWTETDSATGNVNVVRFPLAEQPVYYLEISETEPVNLSVDESHGKVLVSFRDDTPESPFYYLCDPATDEIMEMDVDPAFFSNGIHGNGQFCILD